MHFLFVFSVQLLGITTCRFEPQSLGHKQLECLIQLDHIVLQSIVRALVIIVNVN